MVPIATRLVQGLICTATHGPSGAVLSTDAPADIGGSATSFSPTDLVATALATCIATTLEMVARRHSFSVAGIEVSVTKEMTDQPPRRIHRLATTVRLPVPRSTDPEGRLEKAAHACPVHRSLLPEIEKPIQFHWADEAS